MSLGSVGAELGSDFSSSASGIGLTADSVGLDLAGALAAGALGAEAFEDVLMGPDTEDLAVGLEAALLPVDLMGPVMEMRGEAATLVLATADLTSALADRADLVGFVSGVATEEVLPPGFDLPVGVAVADFVAGWLCKR